MNLNLNQRLSPQTRLVLFRESVAADEVEGESVDVPLTESAKLGDWLESQFGSAMHSLADHIFGEGYINRKERKGIGKGILEALDAFRKCTEASDPDLYKRPRWTQSDWMKSAYRTEAASVEEAGEFTEAWIPLYEKAVRDDGTISIKLIEPGWGSSGYYPPEVLERDGPKCFPKGTQMFWNHATATEEMERPEGDLDYLAGVLTNNAVWKARGPDGPGLYANARVFEQYQDPVDDMAPHIGLSIRAMGKQQTGEAKGKKGPIITSLVQGKSVDFVTKPGAGGKVVKMFEAAGRKVEEPVMDQKEFDALKESLATTQTQIATLVAVNARLQESVLQNEARGTVSDLINASVLPSQAKDRLRVSLSQGIPMKEGAVDTEALKTKVKEGIDAEINYLKSIGYFSSGVIEGMGSSAQSEKATEADVKSLEEGFAILGLSATEVKQAVRGRG